MTLEQAKEEAWNEYTYEGGNLYSTSFKNGFELGAEWKESEFKSLFEGLLSKQKEIISSPIRFNGVHINDIIEVFKKYGIINEISF